jgi:hypothetical protein
MLTVAERRLHRIASCKRWRKQKRTPEQLKRYLDYQKIWRLANPDYHKKASLKWYYQNPIKAHAIALNKRYGISINVYNDLFKQQKGACGICKKSLGKKHLALDHNHKTGEIRGLLCGNCNLHLGYFEKINLKSITQYLKRKTKGTYVKNKRKKCNS